MIKKKNEFESVYNIDVQKILLSFLIADNDVFVRCRNIIKDTYFDEEIRRAVRFVLNHTDEYKTIPGPALIQAKTGIDVKTLSDFGEVMNADWFLETIVKFCRHKEFEQIIYDSYDLLQKGEESSIETRVKAAQEISLVKDLGLDYFEAPKERLQRMKDRPNLVSTGYNSIDEKLFGGFEMGGLNVFIGLPNSGKSLILQNLAVNWALMGKNTVYFTIEMGQDQIAVRLDAMLTGLGTREVFKDIDDTATMISIKGKKAAKLNIVKMKDSGTTVTDLRAYIKEYQIRNGHLPDAIVVDYLDIMYPTDKTIPISDTFTKDKVVSEELRGLMDELKAFGATASQINRTGVNANGEFDYSHVAGGISKVNTADNILFIHAPMSLKTEGFYELVFGKTRTAAAVGHRVRLLYNPICMRISEIEGLDILKPFSAKEMANMYAHAGIKLAGLPGAPEEETDETPKPIDVLDDVLGSEPESTEPNLMDKLKNRRPQS